MPPTSPAREPACYKRNVSVLVPVSLFFAILVVGYIYVWRKGVLDWGPEHDPDYVRPPAPGPAVIKRYQYGTRN